MKNSLIILLGILLLNACASIGKSPKYQALPEWMKGHFTDDYGIGYTISDSLFSMGRSTSFHILKWNEKDKYLLTQNDTANKSEKGLYTRIDYTNFSGMEPYMWGFCFTVYDAKDRKSALNAAQADRNNPKKGCNGYPFSRMKRNGN